MTAPALTAGRRVDLGPGRVTQVGVIQSEWIKLRSLRSTWFSLLAAVVIVVGLGTLFAWLHAQRVQRGIGPGAIVDATQVSLRGVFLAQLAVGVLGVLVISGEYGTGMIRSSIAAVPRRLPVLYAKAIVFASVVFVVSFASTLLAFLFGQLAQSSTHSTATLSTPGAFRAVIGGALYLTLIGLMAVGLGFAIRNTAGAIAALFGVVLVAPLLVQALPTPYSTDVAKFLPLNTGTQIISTRDFDANLFAPWTGMGITAVYVVVALVAGGIILVRRDA